MSGDLVRILAKDPMRDTGIVMGVRFSDKSILLGLPDETDRDLIPLRAGFYSSGSDTPSGIYSIEDLESIATK